MSNNDYRYTSVYFMFKLATAVKNRPVVWHHRWRIRLASGSKQAARATPTARSAYFVPQGAGVGRAFSKTVVADVRILSIFVGT